MKTYLSHLHPAILMQLIKSTISGLEANSYWNNEDIVDTQIDVTEIRGVLKNMKLGTSGGCDCLDPEHIYFESEILKLYMAEEDI